MTVVFPLALPAAPLFRTSRFRIMNAVGMAKSPFTFSQQTQVYDGQQWFAQVELPRMHRAAATAWQVFLLKLRGKHGTFLLGDHDALTPRGAATGSGTANSDMSPSVNLAGERVFFSTGWTGITVNILKEGDYIQIGTGLSATLHMVVNDASSDSNGDLTTDIEPALRTDIATGTVVEVNNTVGLFRLQANDPGWESDAAITYGFSFACEEVI